MQWSPQSYRSIRAKASRRAASSPRCSFGAGTVNLVGGRRRTRSADGAGEGEARSSLIFAVRHRLHQSSATAWKARAGVDIVHGARSRRRASGRTIRSRANPLHVRQHAGGARRGAGQGHQCDRGCWYESVRKHCPRADRGRRHPRPRGSHRFGGGAARRGYPRSPKPSGELETIPKMPDVKKRRAELGPSPARLSGDASGSS